MRFDVLVVDDGAVLRTMIVRTLRVSGLPVGEGHQAAAGAQARRHRPQRRLGAAHAPA